MIGANDVTSRTRPAVSVRHLADAVRRLTAAGCRGRRRHLPRPRHHPADRPAAAAAGPPLEPADGRRADHRRRRGRRPHGVAGLGARPGVRLRPRHVQRRRVPPQRGRLRAGGRRAAARRSPTPWASGRPRPTAACGRSAGAPCGRSRRPRPGPPAAPAPRSSRPRCAARTPGRAGPGRCCAAAGRRRSPPPSEAEEAAEAPVAG